MSSLNLFLSYSVTNSSSSPTSSTFKFAPISLMWPSSVVLLLFHFSSPHLTPWASEVALVVKNLPANAGGPIDAGLILGSRRSSGGGNGNTVQYSSLENSID